MKSPHHLDGESQNDSIRKYVCYRISDIERFRINARAVTLMVPVVTDRTTGENVYQDNGNPPSYDKEADHVSQYPESGRLEKSSIEQENRQLDH